MSSRQESIVNRESKRRANIYDVVYKSVNLIFEYYSNTDTELLSNNEVLNFLKDFLRAYNENVDYVDIVIQNMNMDSTGKIDKYNLAVFFLKLAAYESLIN